MQSFALGARLFMLTVLLLSISRDGAALSSASPHSSLSQVAGLSILPHHDLPGPDRDGAWDGKMDGAREAVTRASEWGGQQGRASGRQKGYQDCSEEERSRQFDVGYTSGYVAGFHEFRKGVLTQITSTQGTIVGEREARDQAISVDYARGRQKVQDEQFASQVLHRDHITLRPARKNSPSHSLQANPFQFTPGPDYRYFKPRHTYGTPSENFLYQSQYLEAYRTEFANRYRRAFLKEYYQEYRRNFAPACAGARKKEYRDAYERGYRLGQSQAFSFPFNENSSIEEFDRIRKARFDETYPRYAAEQYRLGRKDEALEFQARPVRLTGVGLDQEPQPGTFGLQIRLRNFSREAIAGSDIHIRVTPESPEVLSISDPEISLDRPLRPLSITEVSGATTARVDAERLRHAESSARLRVSVFYRNQPIGQETLPVKAIRDLPPVLGDAR